MSLYFGSKEVHGVNSDCVAENIKKSVVVLSQLVRFWWTESPFVARNDFSAFVNVKDS